MYMYQVNWDVMEMFIDAAHEIKCLLFGGVSY